MSGAESAASPGYMTPLNVVFHCTLVLAAGTKASRVGLAGSEDNYANG